MIYMEINAQNFDLTSSVFQKLIENIIDKNFDNKSNLLLGNHQGICFNGYEINIQKKKCC